MKRVSLTQGKVALVDDADYELVDSFKWCFDKSNGYAHRSEMVEGKNKKIYLHRFLLKPSTGMVVDHINRNKLDNRRVNIRECTRSENNLNKTLPESPSGHVGVYPMAGGWRAQIKRRGVLKHLGWFKDFNLAVAARELGENKYE